VWLEGLRQLKNPMTSSGFIIITMFRPGLHERTKFVRCNEGHDIAVEIERNQ
jgi:hypothetical protein